MSQPDSDLPVAELLKRGQAAVRAGDKTAGRALLEKVVSKDQNSESGWFWLAAAVDDINEKRTCLGNVLVINPKNERAQRLLTQLNQMQTAAPAAGGAPTAPVSASGANRRNLTLAVGLAVVAVLVLIITIMALSGGDGDDQEGAPPQANANATQPQGVGGETRPSATLPPGVTPSPTQPPSPPPPTWTPKPSNTPVSNVLPTVFPPPPASLPGQLIMRSGQFLGDPNNQSIVLIKPDGSSQRILTPDNSRGHAPVLSPDSSLFAYIQYAASVGQFILQIDNLQNTAPIAASTYWGGTVPMFEIDTPAWSPDGQWLAFVAQEGGSATVDLYRVSLANPSGSAEALQRLTNDDTVEKWPAWSPDAQQLVYVADLSQGSLDGATELRLYNTATGQIIDLTSNGATLIENAPDWSPDGQRIVFDGKEAGSTETDIFWMTVGGTPEKLFDSDANDIQPRFSPDGGYIVFSSDRSGNWDVYIYDITAQTFYQVTTSPNSDTANDWGR